VESGIRFDPDVLKKCERSAGTITVTAKQAWTVKVRIAPPE